MSIFSFVREAGEKILDLITPDNANADEVLKAHVSKVGLGNPTIQTEVDDGTVIIKGEVSSQSEKEKIITALGNIEGVEKVDDQMTVSAGGESTPSRFETVQKGDTLSAISKRVYGDANKYQKIFDANKPMLKDVNKIYPGQVLRIPE